MENKHPDLLQPYYIVLALHEVMQLQPPFPHEIHVYFYALNELLPSLQEWLLPLEFIWH